MKTLCLNCIQNSFFLFNFLGGANLKLRNHNRDTPMDLSLQMGRAKIVEYFMEQGLDVLPKNGNPTRLAEPDKSSIVVLRHKS